MRFRIADAFTASLGRLPNEQQKAAKTTAFDLQTNPSQPGLSVHRLSNTRDTNFWSARVNIDLRIIFHRTGEDVVLCYVGRHDEVYRWAERRKLEPHPATGAAQLVELREVVQEITVPVYVETQVSALAKSPLFAHIPEVQLLGYGIPDEWLGAVRVADEDSVLDLADHLPTEAAEALLELAVGKHPQPSLPAPSGADPFDHPDALRRFRVMRNVEELAAALEYPWEKWAIFLHPEQQAMVERRYNGPARVSGSAGTGKTVVALHRAAYLTRANPSCRVLLATFSDALARLLQTKLELLVNHDARILSRITVQSLDAVASDLFGEWFGKPELAKRRDLEMLISEAVEWHGSSFSTSFLWAEWDRVVDGWQLGTWEDYSGIRRAGRYRRLSESQRESLWPIFEWVKSRLLGDGLITKPEMFGRLTAALRQTDDRPFDYVVVDEAQDVSVPQLRFLAAMAGGKENGLFFAGDLGQRIFQQPFSWREMGIDIRGRSQTLRVNYRTSHQIRTHADRLLDPEIADTDGNLEERRGTISVFNGPAPVIRTLDDEEGEIQTVGEQLAQVLSDGLHPEEIGVFVRSEAELERATAVVKRYGLPFAVLDETGETADDCVTVSTMHLAKGLEFRAVAVMACDAEVIPLQSRVEEIADEADLDEVYNTERNLLYVACTRARDRLLVTGVRPASEFLDDLRN